MTDKLRDAALWKLLTEAREALWQPANPDLCGRIDEALAQQDAQCGLCGADQPFTGSCGGGRENPRALCFADRVPLAQQDAQAATCKQDLQVDVLLDEMLEAAPAVAQVPQGWKLVPVEPTPEMLQAAHDEICDGGLSTTIWLRATCYRAMLNAAPTPPARATLTASEILNMTPESIPAEHDGALLEYARAVIEAYERKNGIEVGRNVQEKQS